MALLEDELKHLREVERCVLDSRRLAILEWKDLKRLALVPACAKEGDHVYLLSGSSKPLVLRDVVQDSWIDHEPGRWNTRDVHLIGECLVDDLISPTNWRNEVESLEKSGLHIGYVKMH